MSGLMGHYGDVLKSYSTLTMLHINNAIVRINQEAICRLQDQIIPLYITWPRYSNGIIHMISRFRCDPDAMRQSMRTGIRRWGIR